MVAIPYASLRAQVEGLYRPPLRRKATFSKVQTVLKEFGELAGVELSTDLTPAAIAAWLARHPNRSPMTVRSYLSTLRACCRLAKAAGWLSLSPFDLRPVGDWVPESTGDDDDEQDDRRPVRHCSFAELEALLDQLDAEAIAGNWFDWRLQALVYTYAHTGLRRNEALGLKVTDVKDGLIRVRPRRRRLLKTRSSARLVGIADDLAVVLSRWIPQTGCEWLFPGSRRQGPWLGGAPGYRALDAVKAAGKRAGIAGLTIHGLRRSLATHARRLGIRVEEVQALLGHSSPQTQEWYVEQDADNARELARRIRFRPAPLALPPVLAPAI